MTNQHKLPPLPYAYDALEPHIDEKTMTIHHTKHHQTYVDKLNLALQKYPELANKPVEELLTHLNDVPEDIRTAVRNHGGGHVNHTFFWNIMTPDAGEPHGKLVDAIKHQWGSFEKFKEEFTASALGLFGSGWTWLVLNHDKLEIMNTPNQDNPISVNKVALLGVDLWEHAAYLKYENRRNEYVAAWWNVVNWKHADEHYAKAKKH